MINKEGEVIIEIKYNRINELQEGLACVERNGWGFVNKDGREVTKLEYDEAEDFSDGLALVKRMENGRLLMPPERLC
ncbi:hypothetical protein C823_001243 [Eubacterium plexicaudatum ASF492]|nr:hypothetical protein C823_001243 [Eubacterium plexicaudatum ASF492]